MGRASKSFFVAAVFCGLALAPQLGLQNYQVNSGTRMEQLAPLAQEGGAGPAVSEADDANAFKSFEQVPVVQRFRARGKEACVEKPSAALESFGLRKKLFTTQNAGLGNVFWQTLMLAVAGALTDRALVIQQRQDHIDLSDFFTAIQKAGINDQAARGAHALQSRAWSWTDLLAELGASDESIFTNSGVNWEDLHTAKQADLKRPLWRRSREDAASCMARALFDAPSLELLGALKPPLAHMSSSDVLVGLHLRFGDSVLLKHMHYNGSWDHASDKRLDDDAMDRVWKTLDKLIARLEDGSGARARLYIATDNPPILDVARARYGDRLIPEIPSASIFHSYLPQPRQEPAHSQYRQSFVKMVAEWFLLALSDVLVQPMGSSYSDTAMVLSMQHLTLLKKGRMAIAEDGLQRVLESLTSQQLFIPATPAVPSSEWPKSAEVGRMAHLESFGFYDEPDSRWMLRKLINLHQAALEQTCKDDCSIPGFLPCDGTKWWQLHFEPTFSCPFERRIGPSGIHGKWVCDPHRVDEMARDRGCLVYSFRGTDRFYFEKAVRNAVSKRCEIHVFSPKPWRSHGGYKAPPPYVHFHVREIGSRPPAVSLEALMAELGHSGRHIDILNIDCQGCEWQQYPGWFHSSVFVRQILLRMTWPADDLDHPTDKAAIKRRQRQFLQTPKDPPPAIPALHRLFALNGYVVTHKEFDTAACHGNCVDMSFLKLDLAFQSLDTLTPSSPFYELQALESRWKTTNKAGCWDSHPGLGPLSVSQLKSYLLGEGGATMFQGWDLKGKGSGLSLQESLGYIDEEDASWKRRKQIHKDALDAQLQKAHLSTLESLNPLEIWYYNYDPSFSCDFLRRLGRFGDGGKWVCDPHRLTLRAEEGGCLVYSIGSVGDSSFEASVYESISPACEIHTFDLNPWSYYTSREMPKFMNYHTQRIGKEPPSKTIPEIVKDLGHTDRTIDLFKIDCEGCEWETFDSWLGAGVNIRMFLVEIHYPKKQEQLHDFFDTLQSHGYAIYRKEPNTLGSQGGYQEYGFIKLGLDF